MNKISHLSRGAAALAIAVMALAGCGGGSDDEAGSPTAFSVVPSDLTITANTQANGGPPAGQCSATKAGTVFIYGGVAPYQIDNPYPDVIAVDKTQVGDRGGNFTVSFKGVCADPVTLVIRDKLDNQITLTLHNKPAA